MKQWFPFTDYDFYAYLTAGMVLLFALDYVVSGGEIMLRHEWPVVQIILVVAVAYVAGQLAAVPASIVLEHWVARRLLQPPISVMLMLGPVRWREKVIGHWFVGRYYQPLPESLRTQILDRVAKALGVERTKISDPEEVFQVAYPVVRGVPDAVTRMDQFRNLYGFSRNLAFVGIVAAIAVAIRGYRDADLVDWYWAGVALLCSLGMFARFMKFYAAFAAEVLRTYASKSGGP